ncbi:MAG: hypothetical protein MZW92_18315 [Comamonadaceae bacterium]|nr:hypothetical protein [Comamonadaceae bacterium]
MRGIRLLPGPPRRCSGPQLRAIFRAAAHGTGADHVPDDRHAGRTGDGQGDRRAKCAASWACQAGRDRHHDRGAVGGR